MQNLEPERFSEAARKGAELLDLGVTDLPKWSRTMVYYFGEQIRPHLERIWTLAQNKRDLPQITPPTLPKSDQPSVSSDQNSPFPRWRFRSSAIGIGFALAIMLGIAAGWIWRGQMPAQKPTALTDAEAGLQDFGGLDLQPVGATNRNEWQNPAEKTDAKAQYEMGLRYYEGKADTNNLAEAVKLFRKAAEQGLPSAQNRLGVHYQRGEGVPEDDIEAVNWYRKAALQGDAFAQYNLGNCCSGGYGTAKDPVEAANWYRKAAAKGDSDAQYKIGNCYSTGDGVTRDQETAIDWFLKAAEQGNVGAQVRLGIGYMTGEGVAPNDYLAIDWFTKAANQGDEVAKKNLALLSERKRNEEKQNNFSGIRTRSGKTYENATVFATMPDAILIKYRSASGGSAVAHIRYEDVTDEMREQFGLTSEGTAQYRNEQERNEALRVAFQMEERERLAIIERQNFEAQQRAEAERVAEYNRQLEAYDRQQQLINQGIMIDQLQDLNRTLEMQRLDRIIWGRR